MSKHPLHLAVAETIAQQLPDQYKLLCDPACGGDQHLPLFVGPEKRRSTRMCCVDLLILCSGKIKAIIEIEESGFLPTKLCGKFLQAALATHFIHQSHKTEGPISYADNAFFIQVLDGSKCLKDGSHKDAQGKLIEQEIQNLLPLRSIIDYRLFLVGGRNNKDGLAKVVDNVVQLLK